MRCWLLRRTDTFIPSSIAALSLPRRIVKRLPSHLPNHDRPTIHCCDGRASALVAAQTNHLTVTLKTAKALVLSVPATLLGTSDEVLD
jgi:hypothetical protein